MATKLFERLSNDYLELLDDKEDFNVIISTGESSKIFQVHSNVLRYRSLYFRNEIAKASKDKNNHKKINLNHISTQQFEIIIKYIYGGVILIEDQDASFIFELMLVACEFLLDELVKYLETHLIETKSSWLRLRFSHTYKTSLQNNQLQDLQKWCNDIMAKYPDKLFESEDFISFPENALISLIKRDDLQMEERKIWDYVIEWGVAQNPGLSSDPTSWTNENFLALKATLKNCLPFIRFFQMTNDDIIDIVCPYHQILEKNLWDDVLKRFITPNRKISSIILPPRVILTPKLPSRVTEPFSTVINEMHAAEIASWVDKKAEAYSVTNNPYEFKLLLRGSRDGFTNESFWNLCDQQTNTVLIIKVNGTDEILGGYNPTYWDKSTNN
ncbi:hypothetical protein C2G38_2201513 [Gigaspora rosea]|uniref:BTB domain-containing protein n=1 Tax=Gigaspora rosea TaxID=44941 RepID=A0A397USB7_9GLOM|nr:hypothetical protein C2G38_2201513 [Gigaspora rosea]